MASTSKARALLAVPAFVLALTACGDAGTASDAASQAASEAPPSAAADKEIRVGFFPGPYADMFLDCAEPVLVADGYTVETDEFTNAIQPNTAVMNGDTNATIFQNIPFMESYNESNDGSVVRIADVPTLKSAWFSLEHDSFDDLEAGMSLSLPNDPTNLSRGLEMLQAEGIVELDPSVESGTFTEQDVLSTTPADLELLLIDAPQAARSLEDVDFGFVLGSWIYASELDREQIVLEEGDLGPNDWIIITTREADANASWAQDLIASYESDEFKSCIDGDPRFQDLAKPEGW